MALTPAQRRRRAYNQLILQQMMLLRSSQASQAGSSPPPPPPPATYTEATIFAFPVPVTASILSTDTGKVAAANSTAVTFFLADVAPTYDYYVNSYTGSDSNNGLTPGTAFATVSAADTAIGTSTGKSIGIKSGTSYNETLYLTSASTTVGVY